MPQEFAKGCRFADRFTILGTAGTGGTACVYRAFDDELDTVVALKVFSVDGCDPGVLSEFWNREVRALSALQHESIAKCLGAGRDTTSEMQFVVLEWIEGVSLEEYLESRGSVAWQQFYDACGRSILSALVHATERNICHRDLSTGNVIVTPAGLPKIFDFGQARVENFRIGLTVAGWKTPPYCPPEHDTGTHSNTRDPYSFCAIAVRAVAGHQIKDHDALYVAFDSISLPDHVRVTFARALERDPRKRFLNSIEFQQALDQDPLAQVDDSAPENLDVPVRLAPGLHQKVDDGEEEDSESAALMNQIIAELNDAVTLAPAKGDADGAGSRIELETQSYRMIADIDSGRSDHLVVIGLVGKRFRIDSLYQSERWMPQVRFTSTLPRLDAEKKIARQALLALFRGLEEFESSNSAATKRAGNAKVSEWANLLEALRHVARFEVAALRYTRLEAEGGAWLSAYVENPEDAEPGQVRTIAVEGKWVFRGEVQSVTGNQCVLISTRPRIDLEAIPSTGNLEIDWQQAKVALDRQARALERIKTSDLPNPELGRLVTGESKGRDEPTFAQIPAFFDSGLDSAKKEIVSRCGAGDDLIVVHGPPGTGKTKLIVELVRQTLRASRDAKILLVSQTHIALDNALERLLTVEPDIACVRIGSGSKEIDPRVERCTVARRGEALRQQVEVSSREFLEARAREYGISRTQVELGLRALEVLGLRGKVAAANAQISTLERELTRVQELLKGAANTVPSTTDRSDLQVRQSSIAESLDVIETHKQLLDAELTAALDRLGSLGVAGRELSLLDEVNLQVQADKLIEGHEHRALGRLLALSDEWILRFGQSDDFKAAIITSSSVVAGTCVGFCREEAASKGIFDLCIVDESSKATTTELLVPLTQSRRAILVGDHHQLPAVIDHALSSPELKERFGVSDHQLEVQLFEELISTVGAGSVAALTTQYRMRGAIGGLISSCFYDHALKTDESANTRRVPNLSFAGVNKAVTWIDPYTGQHCDRQESRVGTSFASKREVQCVVWLLEKLAFVFRHTPKLTVMPSIAVITGYAGQANQIRAEIRKEAVLDDLRVECATVHAFQGREVDIAIYSIARKNRDNSIGMLRDWRHLNVALSRARDFLVIVGGMEFCKNVADPNPFRKIIEFIGSSTECDAKDWDDD